MCSEPPIEDSVTHSGPLEKGSTLTWSQFLGQRLSRLCGNWITSVHKLSEPQPVLTVLCHRRLLTTASPLRLSFRGIRFF